MAKSFNKFMEDVYSQLECNTSEEYQNQYITFTYTEDFIKTKIDYFKNCYKKGMSAYMALTLMTK